MPTRVSQGVKVGEELHLVNNKRTGPRHGTIQFKLANGWGWEQAHLGKGGQAEAPVPERKVRQAWQGNTRARWKTSLYDHHGGSKEHPDASTGTMETIHKGV